MDNGIIFWIRIVGRKFRSHFKFDGSKINGENYVCWAKEYIKFEFSAVILSDESSAILHRPET